MTIHPISEEDSVVAAALRTVVAPMKGKLEGTAGRGVFDDIMERVAVPAGVTFEAATAGPKRVLRSFTSMAAGLLWERPTHTGTSSATKPRRMPHTPLGL
jgi:hypothetical protein